MCLYYFGYQSPIWQFSDLWKKKSGVNNIFYYILMIGYFLNSPCICQLTMFLAAVLITFIMNFGFMEI